MEGASSEGVVEGLKNEALTDAMSGDDRWWLSYRRYGKNRRASFQLFRLRHPLISFEKAWLSSLLAHDPGCRIYARYEGDDVLVISS